MTLRRRLALAAAAAVAVAVVLASAATFVVVRGELRGRVDDQLRDATRGVQLLVGGAPAPGQFAVPVEGHAAAPFPAPAPGEVERREPLDGPAGAEDVFIALPPPELGGSPGYAQVVNADGSVDRPPGSGGGLPVDARVRAVAAGEEDAFFRDVRVDGTRVRVLTERFGEGAIQVARPLEDTDAALRNLALVLSLVCLAGIGSAAFLGRWVARAVLRPVGRLTDAVEHVAATRDLGRRIDDRGGDELARLAASFNGMLAALEGSQAAQRRLVADASHELRTPLTSLRTNLEVLAQDDELPPADRERLRASTVAQLEELTTLVGDLLDLARDPEPTPDHEDVRLDLLVEDVVGRMQARAPARAITLTAAPTLVRGVPGRLERAVRNLLDNALAWGPPDRPVEVRVGDGEVVVRDHGPGIADDDLPHVFDRFFRAASARGTPGSGLGLAIVRSVAEAHGGRVEARRADGGGAELRLALPVVPAALSGTS